MLKQSQGSLSSPAPHHRHARVQVGIQLAPLLQRARRAEHRLGGFRGQLPARIGNPSLHDDRPALHRARDVQRPTHAEVRPAVLQHVRMNAPRCSCLEALIAAPRDRSR
jgi:hypothetical protein